MGEFITSDCMGTSIIQESVEKYRASFTMRSEGFVLPNIKYYGKFSKNIEQMTDEDFFISMPIKNQESIILNVLITLLNNVKNVMTIGLIFDNCSDRSLDLCLDFFENNFKLYPNLVAVHFITSNGELFESTAENILFLLCNQKYFVSLQSDIYFTDETFLNRASKAFALIPELFAVSGKAIVTFNIMSKFKKSLNRVFHFHNFIFQFLPNYRAVKKTGYYVRFLSYFGDLSNPPESYMHYSNRQRNKIYLGEAVIRGPIVWLSKTFRELNGFDDVGFVLGRDDCDLSFRGFLNGHISGYLPSISYSIYEQGTTRKPRSIEDRIALKARQELSHNFPGRLVDFWDKRSSDYGFVKKAINQMKIQVKNAYGSSINLSEMS
jgi:hypothetical protein